MDHFPFIVAAYAVTFLGLGGLTLYSFVRLKKAERALEAER